MSSSSDTAAVRATPSMRGRVLRGDSGTTGGAPMIVSFDRDLGEPLPAVRAAAATAYHQGFDAGMREGTKESQDSQRADHLLQQDRARLVAAALERAGQSVRADLDAQEQERASAIVTIAIALAEAVLGHHVTSSTRRACEAVERAMAATMTEPGGSPIAHLNPDDAALLVAGDLPQGVTVVSDPAISSGDCVLRVADRSVDARLRTALERAGHVLLDTVHDTEDVRL